VLYLSELQEMDEIGVRVIPVYEVASDDWGGERGFITADLITRHVDPADGRLFYVAGPPAMVAVLEPLLDQLGIEDERQMIERFTAAST